MQRDQFPICSFMNISEVERSRLTANFLNAVASGTILASLVAPFVAIGLGAPPGGGWANVLGLSLLGLVLSIVLHLLARRVLLGLED